MFSIFPDNEAKTTEDTRNSAELIETKGREVQELLEKLRGL